MKKNLKARPSIGKQRVKKGFLWLPKTLPWDKSEDRQTRWLETTEWVQEFTESAGGLSEGTLYWWRDIDWLLYE